MDVVARRVWWDADGVFHEQDIAPEEFYIMPDDREAHIARLEAFLATWESDDDLLDPDGDATAGDLRTMLDDAKKLVAVPVLK